MSDVTWQTTVEELTASPLMIEIYGRTYSGRTYLALTHRPPIAFMHCHERIAGTIEQFIRDKDVRVYNFGAAISGRTREEISASASASVAAFTDAWLDALTWARTIVLDTHTDLWELLRLKYFGGEKPETFKGMERREALWADINGEWRMLFTAVKTAGVDLILIGKSKDEYKNDKLTGGIKSAGQKDISSNCDIRLETSFVQADDTSNNSFVARLVKAGINYRMTGVPLTNTTLPQVLSLVYGNDEDDWQ
jgi:hypothetical protein